MTDLKPKTLKDLKTLATELGYTKDQAIQVIQQAELPWPFKPESFRDYAAVLLIHSHKGEELLHKAQELDKAVALPPCPICGAPVKRAPKWDNFFKRGDTRGWSCEQGGVQHFLKFNMQPTFQKLAERWRRLSEAYDELASRKITLEEYERLVYGGTEVCGSGPGGGSGFPEAAPQMAAAAD